MKDPAPNAAFGSSKSQPSAKALQAAIDKGLTSGISPHSIDEIFVEAKRRVRTAGQKDRDLL